MIKSSYLGNKTYSLMPQTRASVIIWLLDNINIPFDTLAYSYAFAAKSGRHSMVADVTMDIAGFDFQKRQVTSGINIQD